MFENKLVIVNSDIFNVIRNRKKENVYNLNTELLGILIVRKLYSFD